MKAEKLQRFYDRRAAWYDAVMGTFGYTSAVRSGLSSLKISLPPRASALDVGCGTGAASEVLRERFPDIRLTGLDLSGEMLNHYTENFPDARALAGDFNDPDSLRTHPDGLPVRLEPASFDLIVSTGAVTEHGRLEVVLPFLSKLLAPGGTFVNLGVRRTLLTRVYALFSWRYQPVRQDRFRESCERAGFTDLTITTLRGNALSRYFLATMVKKAG